MADKGYGAPLCKNALACQQWDCRKEYSVCDLSNCPLQWTVRQEYVDTVEGNEISTAKTRWSRKEGKETALIGSVSFDWGLE